MSIKLAILDLNGTVTNTPFIDKQPLELLPGRLEKCRELRAQGIKLAIASNQGGVAFGFTTEAIAFQEVAVGNKDEQYELGLIEKIIQ